MTRLKIVIVGEKIGKKALIFSLDKPGVRISLRGEETFTFLENREEGLSFLVKKSELDLNKHLNYS